MISGSTRVAAVIGDPVAHSLSPVIHNAAFAAAGVDGTFVALPVAVDDLGAAMAGIRALGLLGVSVTMPHKAAVLDHLDEVSAEAAALGAVNCVVVDGDRLVGHTTDGAGFVDALTALGVDLAGRRVLVLGAGGAGRAVVRAVADAGAGEIGVTNRSATRRAAAVALGAPAAREATPREAADFDVVVNATAVGMGSAPGERDLPLDPGGLRPGQVVVDLVYDPVETGLLAAAAAAGATPVDGVGMLVHQAAHAFTLWTGAPAPIAAMEAAAREALRVKT